MSNKELENFVILFANECGTHLSTTETWVGSDSSAEVHEVGIGSISGRVVINIRVTTDNTVGT